MDVFAPTHASTIDEHENPPKRKHKHVDEPYFNHFDLNEVIETSKSLLKSAVPTSITYISELIIGLACLRFVGKYGTAADLAGASLGYTWANVFCLGIFSVIDQGFCVLGARLYGAGKHRELGILFQRNICVLTVLAIPLIATLFMTEGILLMLGLNPEVAASAGIYLKYVSPALVGMYFFNAFRFYLISQEIFHIQGMVVTALVPLHIFWCYVFIAVLGFGVTGAAIAKSITDCTGAVLLYLYITYSGKCEKSWIPWNSECLKHWLSFLKQTLLLGGPFYVEWISYEISMFVIGALNNEFILGAHGIAINFTIAIFTIPLGNSITMQTYIGNAVGQGSKHKAQKLMVAGLGINTIMTSLNILFLLIFRSNIAAFFTNDPETDSKLQTILLIYTFAHAADTFANHLGGVLRVLGKERVVFASYIFSYIVIAFNCQWFFGVVVGLGYVAVWLSTVFGMYLMLGLMVYNLIKLDWDIEISKLLSLENASSEEDSVYIEMDRLN